MDRVARLVGDATFRSLLAATKDFSFDAFSHVACSALVERASIAPSAPPYPYHVHPHPIRASTLRRPKTEPRCRRPRCHPPATEWWRFVRALDLGVMARFSGAGVERPIFCSGCTGPGCRSVLCSGHFACRRGPCRVRGAGRVVLDDTFQLSGEMNTLSV